MVGERAATTTTPPRTSRCWASRWSWARTTSRSSAADGQMPSYVTPGSAPAARLVIKKLNPPQRFPAVDPTVRAFDGRRSTRRDVGGEELTPDEYYLLILNIDMGAPVLLPREQDRPATAATEERRTCTNIDESEGASHAPSRRCSGCPRPRWPLPPARRWPAGAPARRPSGSAIASSSVDAISAELERAERLVCGACVTHGAAAGRPRRTRACARWPPGGWPGAGCARSCSSRWPTGWPSPTRGKARNAADVLGGLRHHQAIEPLRRGAAQPGLRRRGARGHGARRSAASASRARGPRWRGAWRRPRRRCGRRRWQAPARAARPARPRPGAAAAARPRRGRARARPSTPSGATRGRRWPRRGRDPVTAALVDRLLTDDPAPACAARPPGRWARSARRPALAGAAAARSASGATADPAVRSLARRRRRQADSLSPGPQRRSRTIATVLRRDRRTSSALAAARSGRGCWPRCSKQKPPERHYYDQHIQPIFNSFCVGNTSPCHRIDDATGTAAGQPRSQLVRGACRSGATCCATTAPTRSRCCC